MASGVCQCLVDITIVSTVSNNDTAHLTVNNIDTVKPVNKSHLKERQYMGFTDKWSLLGDYFVLFYQGRVIEV